MAVPKSRHTKSKKGRRRAHIYLKTPAFSNCPKCGKPVLSHRACKHCGHYKGREVIGVLEKLETKEKKQREREIKAKEQTETRKAKPLSLRELSKR